MKAGIPAITRVAVLQRDDFTCQRCFRRIGTSMPHSLHHRKLRSQGGQHDMWNLVTLCGSGTTGCHGWVHSNPAVAVLLGWIVRSTEDPRQVPIVHMLGEVMIRRRYLTQEGWVA